MGEIYRILSKQSLKTTRLEQSKIDPYECLTLNKSDDVKDFIEFKNKKPSTLSEKQHISNQIKEGYEAGEIIE